MTPLPLGLPELALAALLIVAAAGLSWALRLGLQRTLLVCAVRLVVQLVLVGLFLRQVFALSSPWLTAGVVLAMLAAASFEVGSRQRRRLAGFWHLGIGGSSVGIATLGIALFALAGSLRPQPWYDARHTIPLVGIILGTAMNAASLALNQVFASVTRERAAIEAHLALGADRYTAAEYTTVDVSPLIGGGKSWARGVCMRGDRVVVVGEKQPLRDDTGLVLLSDNGGVSFTDVTPPGVGGSVSKCVVRADGSFVAAGAGGWLGLHP